uniref:DRBM domain-containing protein n=1 Tax=Steinernema glaseri TaxID=37863 RepID=A0A1I8A473_9BILA
MDSVPYAFVDSTVELFGRITLNQVAQEVIHPLWKAGVDVHYRNRKYYKVYVYMTENGVKFLTNTGCDDLEPIRKNRRFARIETIINSDVWDGNRSERAKRRGAEEAIQMLKTVASH